MIYNIKKNQLNPENTIQDALKILEFSIYKIIIIKNKNNKILGTVTDGDIRRSLIKNFNTNLQLSKIMNKNPILVNENRSNAEISQIMKSNIIKQVIIIDKDRKLKDIKSIDEVWTTKEKKNTVVIMAGGLGKRLRPITYNKPKTMVEIGGKPLLMNILENCTSQGFKNFYISINYKKNKIKHFLKSNESSGIKINYLEEKKPLGTIGSLSLIKEKVNYPILIINGDILTTLDFNSFFEFHTKHNPFLSIAVKYHEMKNDFGVVSVKKTRVTNIVEKPTYKSLINTGIYILSKEAVKLVKEKKILDFPELVELGFEKKKKINAFLFSDYWIDIGKISDLDKAKIDNLKIKK